ncbi:MAG: sigma-54 dependent transcriptional regulator [Proteobacteria bacterium]|nr:sigma-54 dependent transcriptional regulator [Pseudomonadota bacterium]
MAKVLIVDDDEIICRMLTSLTERLDHQAVAAYSVAETRSMAMQGPFDAVFLDVCLPDGNGLDLVPEIRAWEGEPEVIIVTGAGDPDGAELAIKSGAWDYIEKPSSINALSLALVRAIQYREEKRSVSPLLALRREGIIGSSPQINACLDLVAQAAQSDASVLITGETGTGKEIFATAIHKNSRRASKPFVVVDCAALPQTLVEGILFGHTRGAFTGADGPKDGMIVQAHGGALFLDEIGDLPLAAQKSFLRVLQEHKFRPLGGNKDVHSDFRVIAATNRNPSQMVQQNRFRDDLLYRLQSIAIELPPLRDRGEDIKQLAHFHMTRLCDHYDIGTKGFSPEFMTAIFTYPWPGNVRELVNALERALAASGNESTLYAKHLPTHIRVELARSSIHTRPSKPEGPAPSPPDTTDEPPEWRVFKDEGLARLEREYIARLIEHSDGDIDQARRTSGLGRARLYQLMKKHGISRPR